MPTNLTLTAELADSPDGNIYLSILDRLHTCLGQNFALIEAGYVITRLLQKYDDTDSIPLRRPVLLTLLTIALSTSLGQNTEILDMNAPRKCIFASF